MHGKYNKEENIMRKFSTRVLALSLSTAMLFSMAACGGKDEEENPDATPTTPGQTDNPGNGDNPDDNPGVTEQPEAPIADYIYKDHVSVLPTYWNPLDYQTNDDSYLSGFIDGQFYTFVYNDEIHPVEGREPFTGYKIIPEMAASDPVDVTRST